MGSTKVWAGLGWLVASAGCDVVFDLRRAPLAPPDAAIDAPPPEVCTYAGATQLQFDTTMVVPLHDFASDGSLGMVSAFITTANSTTSRTGAIQNTGPSWTLDPSTRDLGTGGLVNVRPALGDPARVYALETITLTTYIAEFTLGSSGWTEVAKLPIDDRERFGNMRTLGSRRVFVTTQHPVLGDPYTFLKLRVADGAAWDQQDRMSEINAAQIPDLGVLTRDGLTLIYSARPRTTLDYDLYIATRPDLDAPFPVGVPITAINSPADEVDPWIEDGCDRLYFRRGPSYFTGSAAPSEIWLAQP